MVGKDFAVCVDCGVGGAGVCVGFCRAEAEILGMVRGKGDNVKNIPRLLDWDGVDGWV